MAEQDESSGPGPDIQWLLDITSRMLRCRSVAPLLDLAYDGIRQGLGFDRVGLFLVDGNQDSLIERIGTDDAGRKFYPRSRSYPLGGRHHLVKLLREPRLQVSGPGFIHVSNVRERLPKEERATLDGSPDEILRVALRSADTVVGLICVDNLLSRRQITETQILPIVAFANALAVAIEHVSILEERAVRIDTLDADVRRRDAELQWLREIGHRVNGADTLDGVLDIVYDGLRHGLGYDRVGLVLFDWERELFIECRGTDEKGRRTVPTDRVLSLSPDSWIWDAPDMSALRAGAEFYYSADTYADTPEEQRYLLDGEPKHTLVVFLRRPDSRDGSSAEKVTGLISVDNFVSGRPIFPDQAPPLLAFANQVGTALERARVLEREREERSRLQLVLETARAVNSTLDGDQILHELASRLVAALGATVAHISQVDRQRGRLRSLLTFAARESSATCTDRERGELGHYALIEHTLATQQPHAGHAADSDEVFLRRHGLHAEILVPLAVQGTPIGVLELYWNHAVTITSDSVELCVAIAEQAALAMDNARLYEEVAKRAATDALTGLLNHRALLERLDGALAIGTPFALLLLDINDFKLFNDTRGHLVGDAVLVQIAGILRDVCRDNDRSARYGGDEFAVVLGGVSPDEAEAVKARLVQSVRARPFVSGDGDVIPLSVSVGVACYPRDGSSCHQLIAVADAEMYSVKQVSAGSPAFSIHRGASDLLGDSPFGVLDGLIAAIDARDRYTREHSEEVTCLALLLAAELGLGEDARRALAMAGPLHDLGKIAVPVRVLRKPGRLTAEEYETLKRHVGYGAALIQAVLENAAVAEAVACHHERWDGTGYPRGLAGGDIPLLGRIMQVADAASAMRLDRPYREGLAWERVVEELRAGAGSQFDPALIEPFIDAVEANLTISRSA